MFQRVVVLKECPLCGATEPTLKREGAVATQLVHMTATRFALQAAGTIGMYMREEFRIVVWPRALVHKPATQRALWVIPRQRVLRNALGCDDVGTGL